MEIRRVRYAAMYTAIIRPSRSAHWQSLTLDIYRICRREWLYAIFVIFLFKTNHTNSRNIISAHTTKEGCLNTMQTLSYPRRCMKKTLLFVLLSGVAFKEKTNMNLKMRWLLMINGAELTWIGILGACAVAVKDTPFTTLFACLAEATTSAGGGGGGGGGGNDLDSEALVGVLRWCTYLHSFLDQAR